MPAYPLTCRHCDEPIATPQDNCGTDDASLCVVCFFELDCPRTETKDE